MREPDDLITASTAAAIARRAESTIRLWERRGVLPAVVRLPSGIRLYSRRDVERVTHERRRPVRDDAPAA